METVGLAPEMAKRYPAQLSGGQQQRVGVARALAADPPVLLMDEPFSAVDPVVRESLQDELLRLQAELGKTIVFVTHDIDEAVKLGDKVAVFRVGGKLAQYDEPGALLARPADDFVDGVRRPRPRLPRAGLPVRRRGCRCGELPTVALGEPGAERRRLDAGARRRRPPAGLARTTAGRCDRSTRTTWSPAARCTTRASGSLRSALDAALSSPSGQGVAVDGDGAVVGSVSADDVLEALAAVRRAEAAA